MSNPTDVDSEPGSERQDGDRRPPEPDLDFWAVFESAPDIYLLLAPDPPRFTMLAANDARLRATETRYEDVIGRPLFEIFPDNPADPEATGVRNLRSSLEEVLRTGLPRRMGLQKYDIRNAHGVFEERYWEPLNAPVFDDDGRLLYLIHRVEDVTERVRASRRLKRLESVAEATARQLTHETEARESVEAVLAKLRASEERYRLLVDMIPQNVWTADPTGHHTYFSRRWYEFTGASPEESHGVAWAHLLHPDDRERMRARWEHSLATGEPYEIEYRLLGADSEYHWLLGKAMPLRNEAGEIVEWFGTTTDISERKRYEEEREQLLAREREARVESERVQLALQRSDVVAPEQRGVQVQRPVTQSIAGFHELSPCVGTHESVDPKQTNGLERADRGVGGGSERAVSLRVVDRDAERDQALLDVGDLGAAVAEAEDAHTRKCAPPGGARQTTRSGGASPSAGCAWWFAPAGQARCGSRSRRIASFGRAPITRATSRPPLNRISDGMLMTP